MILNVKPASTLKGSIHLPASKSYSIRAHFIAACTKHSRIIGSSDCDDANVAQTIARALKQARKVYHVGESGTSLRFLLPLLPFYTKKAIIRGKGTLIGRPNGHLCAALRAQGMDIRGVGSRESVPITYNGGAFRPGTVTIDGSLSSQFISALLIAAPHLKDDTRILITGKKLVSSDYIVMTRQILAKAGIRSKIISDREILVKGGQSFKDLKDFHVPSDYGLAAFPLAACALVNSKVTLKGYFHDKLIQSDGHILGFLRKMGVVFRKTSKGINLQGPFKLRGGTFSLKDCPDLVPIMSILAMFAKGPTKIIDIAHARAKESDRISDLREELLKVGAKVTETRDSLTIHPLQSYKQGQVLDPHQDHRLAMAFTVLGLKIGCKVKDIECTRKSYPNFIKDMKTLGM